MERYDDKIGISIILYHKIGAKSSSKLAAILIMTKQRNLAADPRGQSLAGVAGVEAYPHATRIPGRQLKEKKAWPIYYIVS